MRNLTYTVILFGSAHQNLRKNGVSVKEKKNSEPMQINRNRSPIPEDNSPKIRMPCQWWYSPALGVLNVECALGPLYMICDTNTPRDAAGHTVLCLSAPAPDCKRKRISPTYQEEPGHSSRRDRDAQRVSFGPSELPGPIL